MNSYIEWSSHEPEPGHFNLTAVVEFVKAAQRADLLVILRPGPFICAERDNVSFQVSKNSRIRKRTLF